MSKILIVDDEVVLLNFLHEVFTRDGHEVITLPNGNDFFKILAHEKPDLVLMDIQIPGEDGLSLLRRMPKEKGKRVAIAAIFSGAVTQELEKEAFAAGAIDVIRKGLGAGELCAKINKILAAKHRVLEESTGGKTAKILIVDDEESIRKFLAIFLIKKGFDVLVAQNGEEAVLLVKKDQPSLVLLDVTMPGMDGLRTFQKIREIDPDIGVVMATGLRDEKIAEEAMRLGAYAYVLKPFDLEYLERVVLTRLILAT